MSKAEAIAPIPATNSSTTVLDPIGKPPGATANIVFVHGLGGHKKQTWTQKTTGAFWPAWIAEEFAMAQVWTMSYPAAPIDWSRKESGLPTIALDALEACRMRGLLDKRLCFIAHSLGGLLVKQMLSEALHNRNYRSFANSLKGIAFLGTPHRGAAPKALRSRGFLFPTSRLVNNLARNDEQLLALNRWFHDHFQHHQFEILNLREGLPVRPLYWIPFLGPFLSRRRILQFFVVDEAAADAEIMGRQAIEVDEDHWSISKPADRNSKVFCECSSFLAGILREGNSIPSRKLRTPRMGNLPVPVDPGLFHGRSAEVEELREAFADPETSVYEIVADGGVGKSTLVWHWLKSLHAQAALPFSFAWSFYPKGQLQHTSNSAGFFEAVLEDMEATGLKLNEEQRKSGAFVAETAAKHFMQVGGVIVLDGVEPLQQAPRDGRGRLTDPSLAVFLRAIGASAETTKGKLVVITTRWAIEDLHGQPWAKTRELGALSIEAGTQLLHEFKLESDSKKGLNVGPSRDPDRLAAELRATVEEFGGHPLSLILVGSYLLRHYQGNLIERSRIPKLVGQLDDPCHRHARRIMSSYDEMFRNSSNPMERACRLILTAASILDGREETATVRQICLDANLTLFPERVSPELFNNALHELRVLKLLCTESDDEIDFHPLIREHFRDWLLSESKADYRLLNLMISERLEKSSVDCPRSLVELGPILRSIVFACRGEAYRKAYVLLWDRVLRGEQAFAVNALGGHADVLSVLDAFFPTGWRSIDHLRATEQPLRDAEIAGLLILMGACLAATRGYSVEDTREVFAQAQKLSIASDAHRVRFRAEWGLVAYNLMRGQGPAALDAATSVDRLAEEILKDETSRTLADRAVATTRFFIPEFAVVRARTDRVRKSLALGLDERRYLAAAFIVDPVASCISYRSLVAFHDGQFAASLQLAKEAEGAAVELEHSHTVATVLAYKAWLAQSLGNAKLCLSTSEQMSTRCLKNGIPFWQLVAALLEAWAKGSRGDPAAGVRQFERSLARWKETGAKLLLPLWHQLFGEILSLDKDTAKQGIEMAKDGLDIAGNQGFHLWKPPLLCAQAQCTAALEHVDGAMICFESAVRSAREIGSVGLEVSCSNKWAHFLNGQREMEKLRELLNSVGPHLQDAEHNLHCQSLCKLRSEFTEL